MFLTALFIQKHLLKNNYRDIVLGNGQGRDGEAVKKRKI